jgi:two-component system, OmpR family, KDP operon response regulator KdpE
VSVVLLVEDDTRLRLALRATLRTRAFDVIEAATGEEALVRVASDHPDLIVLDLRLPGIDGIETLRHLRTFSSAPVVVLTVRDGLEDKITALDAGADDYVVKPFESDELLARVRANLRRGADAGGESEPIVRVDALEVDLVRRRVTLHDEPLALTPLEFRLLEELVKRRGRLVTREELLERVWGPEHTEQHGRLRVSMQGLRRKIGDDAFQPRLIFTEPGLGYRWNDESET